MSQRFLVMDYETKSKAELKLVGGYEYANHPSTRIMCASWKLGTIDELVKKPEQVWSPYIPSPYGELKRALLDPNITLVAANAFFEQVITRFVLSKIIHEPYLKEIPSERWICTASIARALALPGKLEQLMIALNLGIEKDMEGHRLMMKMSKPRKPTKNNSSEWHNKVSDLKRLMEYCKTDVRAEALVLKHCAPLIPFERKVWELDQRINFRGFRVDRPLVKKSLKLIDEEISKLNEETYIISKTALATTNKLAALKIYLDSRGVVLPNMQAKTIVDALKAGIDDKVARRLLEIRQAVSKTSTAKFVQFEARTRGDGRCRDNLVYHLAGPGRWGGAGVQPQNFPRGTIKNTGQAIDIIKNYDLAMVRACYGSPMEVFSSILRGCILPSEGAELYVGDYASIEVRVLFWLANHHVGLKAYYEGRDLYREMAAVIFGVKLDDVTSAQREVGKRAILGCGYGMGADKFMETCEKYGMPVTLELAETAVAAYRKVHAPVVQLWRNYEKAAKLAIRNPSKRYSINKTKWFMRGRFLMCELPSGRAIAFADPKIEWKWVKNKKTGFRTKSEGITHWGVNPITRKWAKEHSWGGKLVENVDQGTARDNMAQAMFKIEDAGYKIVLTVHDEVVSDKKNGDVKEFEKLMASTAPWAKGLPVKVDAKKMRHYEK
jgi:DNA polymerase